MYWGCVLCLKAMQISEAKISVLLDVTRKNQYVTIV